MFNPPEARIIIPPPEGWEAEQYYLVNVAFNANNPVHRAIFYSGFLSGKEPGSYNMLTSPGYERNYMLRDVHFMSVVRNLRADMDAPTKGVDPKYLEEKFNGTYYHHAIGRMQLAEGISLYTFMLLNQFNKTEEVLTDVHRYLIKHTHSMFPIEHGVAEIWIP